MPQIRRAIISCYDKTGVVELAQLLQDFGVDIISTSGTLEVLTKAGIKAQSIRDFTGVPEMLDGRVKSLHSKVHAGLLGVRDNRLHCEQMQNMEMPWIDMLVANPKPLDELLQSEEATMDEIINQIDIGGTAMIRSAAKNFRYVTVAVNPQRYPNILHELRAHEGAVSFRTRYALAQEAFAAVAAYDQSIADYLQRTQPPEA
jgi:phosphoribosylaminoimidazolecarboxamide formyltransferase/IMP cyclohydrolase